MYNYIYATSLFPDHMISSKTAEIVHALLNRSHALSNVSEFIKPCMVLKVFGINMLIFFVSHIYVIKDYGEL